MKTFGWGVLLSFIGLAYAGYGGCAESGQPPSARDLPSQSEKLVPAAELRRWLSLQSGGKEAGPAQTIQGQAASNIYQRYLKSFTQPIPEFFDQQSGTSTKPQ